MTKLYQFIIDLSKYECEKENFAHGANATVSLYHLKDNTSVKVVVKNINVDEYDPDIEKHYVREVSLMAALNHPCVIKLIGFLPPSQADQTYKIMMPYLPNKNLRERLLADQKAEEKLLTPTRRSIIIYGIASAMEALHLKNVVHRDLKPENVFLDENFHPIVSDLGFSRVKADDVMMTTRLGSPFFMAPELWGDNITTNKIDVYAFGVSILQMFTPQIKFDKTSPKDQSEFIRYILRGDRYKIPDEVPEFYKSLIERCWVREPDERPSFKEIIEMFDESDDFMLPDSNVEEVKEFISHLKKYIQEGHLTPLSNSQHTETEEFNFI